MKDLLIFTLVVVFGLVPFGFGVMYFLYKRTIVFVAASIVFVASMFTGIVAFAVSEFGFISLIWAIPLCLGALVSVNFVFKRKIQRPLIKINNYLSSISKGILDFEIADEIMQKNNEIGAVANSLSKTLEGLHNTSDFATKIANGNLGMEYKLLSSDDEIGLALLNMQKSLTDAVEQEDKRKKEEKNAAYITNGIAKFGELLRLQTNDMKALGQNLMAELVDYTKVAQGGLFVLNEENEHDMFYELAGAVAYGRNRMFEKNVREGEGLIGRCIYEKLSIFLTEIPENYVNITSGLGESNPRCILLVPAMVEEKVYAVIELASFNKLDKHVVEFIEKLANNIASVIASVRNHEQTAKLLEESKANSEEMAVQEEELRQNIEELQTTQEEMHRKELQLKELEAKLEAQGLMKEPKV